VIEAARLVVSEFGTEASMELIASRAGVGVGTLYRRFPNKEALLNELIQLAVGDLIEAARQALDRGDGSGLENFLRVVGRSLSEHRGYGDKLVSSVKPESADRLRQMMAELLSQAQRYDRIRPDITLGDVTAVCWAIRGIITTTGAIAPHAWERHLEIQLAGMRSAGTPSTRRSVTHAELILISGASRGDTVVPR
jgi:AcrR family transcriptional regulator